MSNKQLVLDRIAALGVPFAHYEHAPAHTIADCYALPYFAPDITICKNILLCNRQQTDFYLYVTMPDKPFRTADVSKKLGVSRLSFAPTDRLPELVELESGSLAPFALWFSHMPRATLVLDDAIRSTPRIAFHPCDNTATVIFTQADFWEKVVPAIGGPTVVLSGV